MMSVPDYIAEAITGHYGERCEDFDPACYCCQAWAQYDLSQASVAAALEAGYALGMDAGAWDAMSKADGDYETPMPDNLKLDALITPDQRTALQAAIDAAVAEARAEIIETVRGWRNDTPMTGEECAVAISQIGAKP